MSSFLSSCDTALLPVCAALAPGEVAVVASGSTVPGQDVAAGRIEPHADKR